MNAENKITKTEPPNERKKVGNEYSFIKLPVKTARRIDRGSVEAADGRVGKAAKSRSLRRRNVSEKKRAKQSALILVFLLFKLQTLDHGKRRNCCLEFGSVISRLVDRCRSVGC